MRRCARLVCVLLLTLAPPAARAAGKGVDGVVNLNTAPVEALALLPGIGPSKAEAILGYRQRHAFRTVDELVRIKGIGRKMVRALRAHLAVGGPTTATPSAAQPAHAGAAPAPPPPAPLKRPPPPVCVRPAARAPRPSARAMMPSHGSCPRPP